MLENEELVEETEMLLNDAQDLKLSRAHAQNPKKQLDILEFAEDQRDIVKHKLSRGHITEDGALDLLMLNFKWLTSVLTDAELSTIDEIKETDIKDQCLVLDGLEVETQLEYRGKTFYLAHDDDGQCVSLYINNAWVGLGTYNFGYVSEMTYLIRSDYWLNV